MADAAAAADAPVDKSAILTAAKGVKEWSRVLVFDDAGQVWASTFTVDPIEIQGLLKAWDERDVTVGEGLTVDGLNFDVHRWYDTLIYGRRGDAGEGEGIALHKVVNVHTKKYVFALITYTYPMLSARAVPMLQDFCKKYVANVKP